LLNAASLCASAWFEVQHQHGKPDLVIAMEAEPASKDAVGWKAWADAAQSTAAHNIIGHRMLAWANYVVCRREK